MIMVTVVAMVGVITRGMMTMVTMVIVMVVVIGMRMVIVMLW